MYWGIRARHAQSIDGWPTRSKTVGRISAGTAARKNRSFTTGLGGLFFGPPSLPIENPVSVLEFGESQLEKLETEIRRLIKKVEQEHSHPAQLGGAPSRACCEKEPIANRS